jgi:hypothetical protein
MAKLNVVFGAVTNPLRRGLGKVKSMVGGLTGLLAGGMAIGLAAVAAGITKIITAGAKMESIRVNFEVLLGSAEKANATIKQLRSFANVTPFDTNSVIKASRGLIASGSAGKVLGKELQIAGDIAAGTGLRIEDVTKMYAKMKNMGKITYEEINQLTNAGALSMKELYEATGKTKRTFRAFVEAGRADFSIIKGVFEKSTGAGGRFFEMMLKKSDTLEGRWSTLTGKTQDLFASLGEGATSPLTRVVDALIDGVDALSKWSALFDGIASSAETIAKLTESIAGSKGAEYTNPFTGEKEETLEKKGILDFVVDYVNSSPMFRKMSYGSKIVSAGLELSGYGSENIVRREQEQPDYGINEEAKKILEQIRDNTGSNTSSPGSK